MAVLSGCDLGELPGDIAFGEHTVTASLLSNGCKGNGIDSEHEFVFRARLAADLDQEVSWLSVAKPVESFLQAPRPGIQKDGEFMFESSQSVYDESCNCHFQHTEVIQLSLVAEDDNANSNDNDNNDNDNEDEDEDTHNEEEPPIQGLPHPRLVTGITGELTRTVHADDQCRDSGDSCLVNCTIDFILSGTRMH